MSRDTWLLRGFFDGGDGKMVARARTDTDQRGETRTRMTASKLKTGARLAAFVLSMAITQAGRGQSAWVHYDNTHTLVYSNDVLGNHIPDFSYAGYQGGGVPLPTNAVVQQTVSAIAGDNTANIQNAINAVGNLGLNANGFRGVVSLNPGVL